MKKYYFMWYNCILGKERINFISAKNKAEAKQIAILIMKFIVGDYYKNKDLHELKEINDNDIFTTMDMIKEKYEMLNINLPS